MTIIKLARRPGGGRGPEFMQTKVVTILDSGIRRNDGVSPAPTGKFRNKDYQQLQSHTMKLLLVWIINSASLITVAYLLPGVTVASFTAAFIAALVLGLVNTFVRPIMVMLTLPATLLTLGLFLFVINGLLFWFVGTHIEGFTVDGFWAGVAGAFVYSLIAWVLSIVFLPKREKQN